MINGGLELRASGLYIAGSSRPFTDRLKAGPPAISTRPRCRPRRTLVVVVECHRHRCDTAVQGARWGNGILVPVGDAGGACLFRTAAVPRQIAITFYRAG